jgi:hypothetical protein
MRVAKLIINSSPIKTFETKEVKKETIGSKIDCLISRIELKLTSIGQKFF